jgi:hypothetical protein
VVSESFLVDGKIDFVPALPITIFVAIDQQDRLALRVEGKEQANLSAQVPPNRTGGEPSQATSFPRAFLKVVIVPENTIFGPSVSYVLAGICHLCHGTTPRANASIA